MWPKNADDRGKKGGKAHARVPHASRKDFNGLNVDDCERDGAIELGDQAECDDNRVQIWCSSNEGIDPETQKVQK